MLLKLENTDRENVNLLLHFAKQNQLKLSIINDNEDNYFLPGKPLSDDESSLLIENSRKVGRFVWEMPTLPSENVLVRDTEYRITPSHP